MLESCKSVISNAFLFLLATELRVYIYHKRILLHSIYSVYQFLKYN